MQFSAIVKISAIVILVFLTIQCSAIRCYSCNSYDDAACGDPFQSLGNDSRALIDCDSLRDGRNYTFCRKTIQTASLLPDQDTLRVVRRCGYIQDPKLEPEEGDDPAELRCYRRTGTYSVEFLYCACHTDGCNSANPLLTVSFGLLISLSILAKFL